MNKARILPWIAAAFVVGILTGIVWSEYRHYELNQEKSAYDASVNLIGNLAIGRALEAKNFDLAAALVSNSIKSVVENSDDLLDKIKNSEQRAILKKNIELGTKMLKK